MVYLEVFVSESQFLKNTALKRPFYYHPPLVEISLYSQSTPVDQKPYDIFFI